MENRVTVVDLAKQIGVHKSQILRDLKLYGSDLGISAVKQQTPGSRSAKLLTLHTDEANRLLAYRQERGLLNGRSSIAETQRGEFGVFYVVQLVPEFAADRVKLGFAESVEARLASHRTAAPTLVLARSWPCRRSWEAAAMAALTVGCELVAIEVFDCDSLSRLIERGDQFFGLMPDPAAVAPLSEHSPLRTRP